MKRFGQQLLALQILVLAACGGSPDVPAETPSGKKAAHRAKKGEAKDDGPRDPLLGKCPGKSKRCLPPQDWVEKLCEDVYPDVALHLFRPKTQYLRLYMLHSADPFNASGGMSLMGDKMRRGEEVIALRRRNSQDTVQAADISGYDVLRWNGACASIHDGEFTSVPPNEVHSAKIEWRLIGLPLRLELEKNTDISDTYEARRKACKAIRLGRVSADCEELDKKLTDEVVRHVRAGKKLPPPAKAP